MLESIQDQYGAINLFEMDLLGLKVQAGDDGKEILRVTEPSVRAIRMILPLMINEGLAIEATETGRPYDPVTEQEIIQECCIPYDKLSKIIHDEFKRCFGKKQQPGGKTVEGICR